MKQKDIWTGFVVGSIAIFSVVGIFIFGFCVQGFSIMKLWSWFIVPLGVRPVNFWESLGLGLTVHLLCPKPNTEYKKDKALERFAISLVRPLFALGFGYIIKILGGL